MKQVGDHLKITLEGVGVAAVDGDVVFCDEVDCPFGCAVLARRCCWARCVKERSYRVI